MTMCALQNLPDAYIDISAVRMNSHSIIDIASAGDFGQDLS